MTTAPLLTLGPERLSRTTLALFAGASGDHNPIHIDLDVAWDAGRQDVFAHGMLSMALLGRMLTGAFPLSAIETFEVRFLAITEVNAEPVCTARVVSYDGATADLALEVRVDDTVTVSGTAKVHATDLAASFEKE